MFLFNINEASQYGTALKEFNQNNTCITSVLQLATIYYCHWAPLQNRQEVSLRLTLFIDFDMAACKT